MSKTDFFKINHFKNGDASKLTEFHQFDTRKRSYYETFCNDGDEDMLPKSKYQATEEKVTNAFKNLNLNLSDSSDSSAAAATGSRSNGYSFKDMFNLATFDEVEEQQEEWNTGILLSTELRQTLEKSKQNSDFDLLKKISNGNRDLNADSRLQVVLWDPNKNMASKIINEMYKNKDTDTDTAKQEIIDDIELDCKSSASSSSSSIVISNNNEYTVEEPIEAISTKRSLKRSYSQVNKLSIEELQVDYTTNSIDEEFTYEHLNDPSKYYIVDEPALNSPQKLVDVSDNPNKVVISEFHDNDSDSMEL